MSDTVFRSTQTTTPSPATSTIESKNDPQVLSEAIEVPYLDYEAEHGKPYMVDHFKLGDHWNDDMGGFSKEIAMIEGYVTEQIKSGEIANSQTAVKELLRSMEKMNNLSKEERTVIKMEVLSHYVEFLRKNSETRRNLRRYNAY